MEITIVFDDMYNELYQISKLELIAKDEKFKLYKLVKGSYEFKGEVLRKDYKEIKEKNRKKGCYLVRFERLDGTIVKLIHQDNMNQEELKQQKVEDKYLLKLKKEEEHQQDVNMSVATLNKTIKVLKDTLDHIDLSRMDLKDIERYNTYLTNVVEKIKINDLKDTSTTKKINKTEKIALYKKNIHKYVTDGKYSSINQLCKDLDINRKTLYNYHLDSYIKEII